MVAGYHRLATAPWALILLGRDGRPGRVLCVLLGVADLVRGDRHGCDRILRGHLLAQPDLLAARIEVVRQVAGHDLEADARGRTPGTTEVDIAHELLADLYAGQTGAVAHAAPVAEGRADVELRRTGDDEGDDEEDEVKAE